MNTFVNQAAGLYFGFFLFVHMVESRNLQRRAIPDSQEQEVSTWEVSFDQNLRRSRILGLPDEVLLDIMHAAKPADLYMLRQASFTFWRLYRDETFARFHRIGHVKMSAPVPLGKETPKPFEVDEETRRRAKENGFCGPCLSARTSRDFQKAVDDLALKLDLYCFHCQTRHSRLMFPSQQRSRPRPLLMPEHSPPRCIVATGLMRLCSHRNVSLSTTVLKWIRGARGETREKLDAFLGCTLTECTECRDLATETVSKRWVCEMITPPTLLVNRFPGYAQDGKYEVRCCWTLPVFSVPEGRVITRQFLHGKLSGFKERFGEVLCPHINPSPELLLGCFDPEFCSCLGGDSRVGNTASRISEKGGVEKFFPGSLCSRSGNAMEAHQFLPPYPSRHHDVTCRGCPSYYSWRRWGGQVFLCRTSTGEIELKGPDEVLTEGLVRFLDPATYAAGSDVEAKHLVWCDDGKCRNGRDWTVLSNYLEYQK